MTLHFGSRLAVVIGLVALSLSVAAAPYATAQTGTAAGWFSDSSEAGVHRAAVDYLGREGILEGTECTEATFCPDEAIPRWVMAVWLVRILDGVEPSAVDSSRFADVNEDEWWAPYVERLADLGVTRGCAVDPARFCPNNVVKREQMASFLVRAFQLKPVTHNVFKDTADSSHTDDINTLAAAGVTAGCAVNPARFCPSSDTTKAEMATFLVRALGVNLPHSDVERCRPPSGVGDYGTAEWYGTAGYWGTAGFPMPKWVKQSEGVLRVAVLFVDFPNAPASHSTQQEAALGLPYTEKYLEAASYGRLDVQFTTHDEWLRAQNNYQHYLGNGNLGGTPESGTVYTTEVAKLGDAAFDFSKHDLLMIVAPSSHFGGGNAHPETNTAEGPIWTVRNNTYPHQEPGTPQDWGKVAAHEIIHTFGILDQYPFDNISQRQDPSLEQRWIRQSFGVMGVSGFFTALEEDPRLARVWSHPDGTRTTTYDYWLDDAAEMLAWNRWLLGWLNTSQIVCVTDPKAIVGLRPVATPAGGTAMIGVPLSATKVMVIESRRKLGYDAGREFVHSSTSRTTVPSLAAEGIFIYTVDTAIPNGKLPIRIAGDPGDLHLAAYPVLTPGWSAEVHGYTVTLVSSTSTTHTVAITRNGTN